VIDVAAGEKIPRKGGPGITKSDLFVINKTDLAPYVGASLDVMETDTRRMRGARPYVMTNLKTKAGLADVVAFTETRGMLRHRAAMLEQLEQRGLPAFLKLARRADTLRRVARRRGLRHVRRATRATRPPNARRGAGRTGRRHRACARRSSRRSNARRRWPRAA